MNNTSERENMNSTVTTSSTKEQKTNTAVATLEHRLTEVRQSKEYNQRRMDEHILYLSDLCKSNTCHDRAILEIEAAIAKLKS